MVAEPQPPALLQTQALATLEATQSGMPLTIVCASHREPSAQVPTAPVQIAAESAWGTQAVVLQRFAAFSRARPTLEIAAHPRMGQHCAVKFALGLLLCSAACGGSALLSTGDGGSDTGTPSLSCRRMGTEEACTQRADCFWLQAGPYYCHTSVDGGEPAPIVSSGCTARASSGGPMVCRDNGTELPCPHGERCTDHIVGRDVEGHHADCPTPKALCWDVDP